MQVRPIDFEEAVFVLGAGFSVPSGLPPTNEVNRQFLDPGGSSGVETTISNYLSIFWQEIFGHMEGGPLPSLEDHFTALDLAANSGHNLGRWTPAMLRALRRMSIHRVFEILNRSYRDSPEIEQLVKRIAESETARIVSTNWDIVVEKHAWKAGIDVDYGISGTALNGEEGVYFPCLELSKLHGSANWHYCDSCRLAFWGVDSMGKTTLEYGSFVQVQDFERLAGLTGETSFIPLEENLDHLPCPKCHSGNLSARVATFSYQKALGFLPFHEAWEKSLRFLAESSQWIFLGYSLPSADYHLRNLFKVAQMIPGNAPERQVHVVLKDGQDAKRAQMRYKQFFGNHFVEYCDKGLEQWVDDNVQ